MVVAWGALWQACMQAAEGKLRAKTGEQPGEADLRAYTLDAASSIVRGAEGRLPHATGEELVAAAEAAVEVSLAQAKGWRTPAFYAQCREAAGLLRQCPALQRPGAPSPSKFARVAWPAFETLKDRYPHRCCGTRRPL